MTKYGIWQVDGSWYQIADGKIFETEYLDLAESMFNDMLNWNKRVDKIAIISPHNGMPLPLEPCLNLNIKEEKTLTINKSPTGIYILTVPRYYSDEELEVSKEKIDEWVEGGNPALVLVGGWEVKEIDIDYRRLGVISMLIENKNTSHTQIVNKSFSIYDSQELNEVINDMAKQIELPWNIKPGSMVVTMLNRVTDE